MEIVFYIIGVLLLLYCIKNELITMFFIWPFILYGLGVVFALNWESIPFANWITEDNIYHSMYIMILVVFLPVLCEKTIFFRDDFLTNKLKEISTNKYAFVFSMVNSKTYRYYLMGQEIMLIMLILASILTGDIIIGNYYPGEAGLWLEIQFLTENILVFIELYIFCMLINSKFVQRSSIFELISLTTILIRVLCGTRLFLFGIFVFVIFIYILMYRNYKKTLALSSIGAIILSILGFFRNGDLQFYEFVDILLPIFSESYFNDITLFIASNIIVDGIEVNTISTFLWYFHLLVPRFLGREVLQDEFSVDQFSTALGVDSLNPVGGFSFIAQFIYAFGNLWLIPLLMMILFIICLRKSVSSSLGVFMIFAMVQCSLHLWRDGIPIALKSLVVHTFVNMFILMILIKWRKRNEKDHGDFTTTTHTS